MTDLRATVLVVDDDAATRDLIGAGLTSLGVAMVIAANAADAVRQTEEARPVAVFLDVGLAGPKGLPGLASIRKAAPELPVLVLAGPHRAALVLDAVRMGATELVDKPPRGERLEGSLDRAMTQCRVRREVASSRVELSVEPCDRLVVEANRAMAAVAGQIEFVADTDAAVIVRGEPGTAKGLVARAVHRLSGRRDRPFVKVPCASLPSRPGSAGSCQEAGAAQNPAPPASLTQIARTAAREADREAIARMLQRTHGNRREAAECLGISYRALLYKTKENGLARPLPTS